MLPVPACSAALIRRLMGIHPAIAGLPVRYGRDPLLRDRRKQSPRKNTFTDNRNHEATAVTMTIEHLPAVFQHNTNPVSIILRINHLPLLQSGSTGCALDIIYRKDKQAIGAERYTNRGLFLRVLSGVSSVFLRKKDVFSEQVPKDYRRSTEEKGKETCQNLPKPDNSRHSFPEYLKTGNPVVPSFR